MTRVNRRHYPRKKLRNPSSMQARHVKQLKLMTDSKGEHIRLGGYWCGDVYAGRVKFSNGSVHRVAVKLFKHKAGENYNYVRRYRKVIRALRYAGVSLPKMDFVKMPKGTKIGPETLRKDTWVLVSQAFVKRSGGKKFLLFGKRELESKIVNKSYLNFGENRGLFEEGLVQMARTANAGYEPAMDLVEPFKDASKGIMPLDLDSVVNAGKTSAKYRADCLLHVLKHTSREDRNGLFNVVYREANEEIRKALDAEKNRLEQAMD